MLSLNEETIFPIPACRVDALVFTKLCILISWLNFICIFGIFFRLFLLQ